MLLGDGLLDWNRKSLFCTYRNLSLENVEREKSPELIFTANITQSAGSKKRVFYGGAMQDPYLV